MTCKNRRGLLTKSGPVDYFNFGGQCHDFFRKTFQRSQIKSFHSTALEYKLTKQINELLHAMLSGLYM